ncbi:MAG TPA: ATP-dependent metallopeptidase FtsH/Yme1/Tma family protein, partial [Patescibacteria group bacterium]
MAINAKKLPNGKKKIVKIKAKFSWKNLVLYGFLLLFTLFLFSALSTPFDNSSKASLSDVVSLVKKGQVSEIVVTGDKLTVTKKDGEKVQVVKEPGSDVYTLFKNAGVPLGDAKVTVKDESSFNNWMNIFSTVLPVILMIAFFYFIFRQARGTQENIFSFGQSRAKLFNKDNPKVTFEDVAGVDEAKQELTEIVDFLKNPVKYKAMGARTPKGVLMVGPAGTGKTLLARATAGEAGVAFFSMAGSEFMEMLVGVGASRVRDLF